MKPLQLQLRERYVLNSKALCDVKCSKKKIKNKPIVFALLGTQNKMYVGMNLSLADRSCNC